MIRGRAAAAGACVLAGFALAGLAYAGSLCGTVRDAQTEAPVANAGIFLRTTAGAYTGIHGASDAGGAFCIHAVPEGTYDLEVRVDDYQVAYVRNVHVGPTTDVAIGAVSVGLRLAAPAPQPARDHAVLRWTLPLEGPAQLAIHDAAGRFVRGWSATLPAGAHTVRWDLRDDGGRAVKPGVYFVALDAGGERRVRRLVRIL